MRLGTVKFLNSVKTQALPEKPPKTNLPYVEVKVRNTKLYALVDTGALNMFLSSKAVKSLRLRVEPTEHRLKAVNSDNVLAIGISRNVELHIGDWKGKFPIEVNPLDEYDLILDLEAFDNANTNIDMRTKSYIITEPKCPLVVPMIFVLIETKSISTI